jgi:hypothetical protein
MTQIYVLKLENGKFYIGKSNNIEVRLEEHINGNGSSWTRKHPPIYPDSIIEIKDDTGGFNELATTLKYMKSYGIDNVRGADYSQVVLSDEDKREIKRHINSENGLCFGCSKSGHFISICPNKKVQSFLSFSKLKEFFCCGKKRKDELSSKIINFGKHKGKTYEEVWNNNLSYCMWVLEQKSVNIDFINFQKWCKIKEEKSL